MKQTEFATVAASLADVRRRYVDAFPALRTLDEAASAGSLVAARDFARNACRLVAPSTVTPQEIWKLAKLTQGWK